MTKHPMEHQTVMEYVIVTLVILAAVAIAVWLFGTQICAMFGVAGDAACGAHEEAAQRLHEMRSADCSAKAAAEADNRWSTAAEQDNRFTDADDFERGGQRSSGARQSMVTPVPLPDDGGETPSEAFGK